jgi:hypothetical protein
MGINRGCLVVLLALCAPACKKSGGGGAVMKAAPELVGFWERSDDGIADFIEIELKADGTYDADLGIQCETDPCPSDAEGKWLASDFAKNKSGKLSLSGDITAVYDATLATSPKRSLRLVRQADRGRDRDATFELGQKPR